VRQPNKKCHQFDLALLRELPGLAGESKELSPARCGKSGSEFNFPHYFIFKCSVSFLVKN
jgi:hypothetical protein